MVSCRWSRIARKLPGRTDNEIKNYWRTHMRKKAQEKKCALPPPSPSSNCSSASSNPTTVSIPLIETGKEILYDTEWHIPASNDQKSNQMEKYEVIYSMDDIWKEIALTEGKYINPEFGAYVGVGCDFSCPPVSSPSWEYSSDTLWQLDDEDKIFPSMGGKLFARHDA
ncbi:hypothetical protein SAY87_015861 [Trapa incisa]|uniref:Uncharacterized protein n=1 Tax=Trapa incisa TaxID=236973 RepID=A0AAN7LE51_9MYRT|nr:hypothetical protein SAY87_015861 [Trapa incisa]